MKRFEVGKLPQCVLEKLLAKHRSVDPRLVVGPEYGEDAAVIEFGESCIVISTDPITFTEERIGWYAVNVNANDVATMGAPPKWFAASVLLPERVPHERLASDIFEQIASACRDLGVTLCGGHTEITLGLDRPIVIGFMLGELPKDKVIRGDGISSGDVVLLTKGIAIEATAILAADRGDRLAGELGSEILSRARRFLDEPGISVVREALLACEAGGVTGMHDPTEGGLATALREMASRASLGVRIDARAINVYPESRAICRVLGVDPLGALGSGALLISCKPEAVESICERIRGAGIPCARIGEFTPMEHGLKLRTEKGESDLVRFERDEVARILAIES